MTGPYTMAPKAFTKKPTLICRFGAMVMVRDLSATRSAIISAAKISMRVSFSSDAACCQ